MKSGPSILSPCSPSRAKGGRGFLLARFAVGVGLVYRSVLTHVFMSSSLAFYLWDHESP